MEGCVATLASGTRVLLRFVGQLYMDFLPFSMASLAESCSLLHGLRPFSLVQVR